MAKVWRAVHVGQKIPVAIKIMTTTRAVDPYFRDAFQNEVRAVAGLHHPNIITVLDYGEVDPQTAMKSDGQLRVSSPYLAMEYASRGSLQRLKATLEWDALLDVLLALLDSLAHAHARGVLHRDIKPANVLLCGEHDIRPGLKLTDFGIAHPLEEEKIPDAQTSGTPLFMAPEQFFARWRDYGPWTDLYALGVMTFGLVTGKLPFKGSTFMQLAALHADAPVPPFVPVHDVPDAFEGWLLRLLEKDPADRFQHAADAAWALMELAGREEKITDRSSELETWIPLGLDTPTGPPGDDETVLTMGDEALTIPWAAKTMTTDAWRKMRKRPLIRERSGRPTQESMPPLPKTWRRVTPPLPPIRLLGAGLGLYGLRVVPLVDRERERDLIWNAFGEVLETHTCQLILLRGAAGNGKSRLVEWISQRADEVGGANILRAVHGPIASPSDGIARMVARYLRCTNLDRAAIEQRVMELLKSRGVTDAYEWRALTELISPAPEPGSVSRRDSQDVGEGWMPMPVSDSGAPDTLMEGVVRLANATERHVATRRLLETIACERPVIVWLDDVQWGSDAIAFAMHTLEARAFSPSPILLLLTARDDLLAERPIEAAQVAQLAGMEGAKIIDVAPLTESDHQDLVHQLLGLSGHLAEQVVERTDGNPLFAVQLVGDWVQRGLLQVSKEGFRIRPGASIELPDDLHHVWSQRIDQVLRTQSQDARIALELAAVLGSDVDSSEWQRVCRDSAVQLMPSLFSELLSRRLVYRADMGWSFAHGMLRESLERSAKEANRFAMHHEICAKTLTEYYGIDRPGVAERIGRHYVAAGRVEDALGPLFLGAKRHLLAAEYPEAEGLLEEHRRLLHQAGIAVDDRRYGDNLVQVARLARLCGRFSEAQEIAERVAKDARRYQWREVQAYALLERAGVAYEQSDPLAVRLYTEARGIFEKEEIPMGIGRCLRGIGDVAYRLGNLKDAKEKYESARAVFDRINDPIGAANCHWGIGYVAMWQGLLDEALDAFKRQLVLAESAGNRLHIGRACCSLAEVARISEDFDAAEEDYKKAIVNYAAVGSPEEAMGHMNLALTYLGRGEYVRARELLEPMRPRYELTGERLRLVYVHALSLPGTVEKQDWPAWDVHFSRAHALLEETKQKDGDVAWAVQLAGDLAQDLDGARARRAYVLALSQWCSLGRDDKVTEIEQALERLE